MDSQTRECPLCHGEGLIERIYEGSFDHGIEHVTFTRRFYRCTSRSCGAVFYADEQRGRQETDRWQSELETETMEMHIRRQELSDRDAFRLMVEAREIANDTITKDREMVKQFKEIEKAIASEEESLAAFMERMRNFAWTDPESIDEWVKENWLPPSFADRSLDQDFGMSRPTLRKDLPAEERALLSRADKPVFVEGQEVVHSAWGRGKFVVGNTDGGSLITAEFAAQGAKRMDLRYANLELVA